MAKLLRIVKIRQLLELLEDSFHINRNFIKVGQLVFVILLVAHCTACAFYCTAQLNSHHDDDDAYVGIRHHYIHGHYYIHGHFHGLATTELDSSKRV